MTEVISLPRRGGKTTALLERMRTTPETVMVTFAQAEAERLWRITEDLGWGIDHNRFVSANSTALRGRGHVLLLVDNAEYVLSALLGYPVKSMSVTTHD